MNDRKVQHVIFGPPGFFQRADATHIMGLDEAETQEILALLREIGGGNPHHNPRYRELWAKYDRAVLMAGLFGGC
ncbi:MAG: hypothetical protein Q8M19_06915 [Reyranella sp.]|nr:hypothetical protein [Reyranella sp.]